MDLRMIGMMDATVRPVQSVDMTLAGGVPRVPTISVIMKKMGGIAVTFAVNPKKENDAAVETILDSRYSEVDGVLTLTACCYRSMV